MDLITMARDLGSSLQSDERFVRLSAAAAACESHEELRAYIAEFNDIRALINAELSKDERDLERVDALNADFRVVHQKVAKLDVMIEYNEAKKVMDTLLTQINHIILRASNGDDPYSIDETACSGDCAGCGGCH